VKAGLPLASSMVKLSVKLNIFCLMRYFMPCYHVVTFCSDSIAAASESKAENASCFIAGGNRGHPAQYCGIIDALHSFTTMPVV
jgi:hypothetical protein